MKAIAPGKIILSGEHSVVYGKPALVMAVNRYASASVFPQQNKQISFDLLDFDTTSSLTIQALRELKHRLFKNYHMFLNGQLGIREVLKKPFELFEFLFITLLDGLQLKMDQGVKIKLSSNIPIGCGMGSSAATILSVLKGVGEYFNLDLNPQKYYDFGLEAEKLQHGFSSGVDPYVSLHGGFVRFQQQKAKKLPMPDMPLYLVNTGIPVSTTGECVSSVANGFQSNKIWDDFENITNAIQIALLQNELKELQRLVKENHLLLTNIGVVPQRINNFIDDIEKWGGAAKIAGAGAVTGENGGIVTVFSEEGPKDICDKYGFSIIPVKGEPLGARIV